MHSISEQNRSSAPLVSPPSFEDVPRRFIGGIRFCSLTIAKTADLLEQWIERRGPAKHICLANAYTIAFCRRNPEMTKLINSADLVLADGMSVVWGARWVGTRLPERVAGPDLTEK